MIPSIQQLISDLFEPTPSPYLNPGLCAKCPHKLDKVVNKLVLDSPPQLIIFEISVASKKSKPALPKNMDIEQTLQLEFSQTMATYRLKGFVTYLRIQTLSKLLRGRYSRGLLSFLF